MLKAKDLKEKSAEELKMLCGNLSKEIYGLNNELRTARKLEKPHLLREKKRTRARVMTVLRQKED